MAKQDGPKADGPEQIKVIRANWRLGQIRDAATSLLAEKAFHEIGVSEVAEAAGISVGTIYEYVRSKEDILYLVIQEVLDSYRSDVPPVIAAESDPVRGLYQGFLAYCRVVEAHKAATALAYRESRSLNREGLHEIMRMETDTTALLVNALKEGVAAGSLRPHACELVGWDLVLIAHMWALKGWHFRDGATVDEYAHSQLGVFLDALITSERRADYADLLGGAPLLPRAPGRDTAAA